MKVEIATAKQAIDLISVVETAGIELHKRGSRYVGLCPFHDEKTPSFFIFPDNRFKCFGCGAAGDVISFIQKLHGVPFKEALKILEIKQGPISHETQKAIKEKRQKRALIRRFREWEVEESRELGELIRLSYRVMENVKKQDFPNVDFIYHHLPIFEYHLQILCGNDDEEKFQLYKERRKYGSCSNF